jgi:hypothetical protein
VSPLLANICLHYALDLWVEQWRRRNELGDIIIVRYADDFVLGFEHHLDAQRFLKELRERLAGFKLELHPEKTRLLRFGRFASAQCKERGESGAPLTFKFVPRADALLQPLEAREVFVTAPHDAHASDGQATRGKPRTSPSPSRVDRRTR